MWVMGRRVGLFWLVGAVLPLLFTANASAQGAVLRATPSVVAPGGTIAVEGRGYTRLANGANSPVLRLSTRTGTPLDTEPIVVDGVGAFSASSVTIPSSTPPGWYLLLATQTRISNGSQAGFTPGRTTVRVQARAGAAGAATRPGGGSGGGLSLPLLLGAVVLGAGSLLTVRRLRTLNRPLGA